MNLSEPVMPISMPTAPHRSMEASAERLRGVAQLIDRRRAVAVPAANAGWACQVEYAGGTGQDTP